MILQVGVFNIQRQIQPLALNCTRWRRRDVEVERVAEFVVLRGATGFDSRGQIASVVPPETRLPQRTQQVPQCLEAQKVQTLVRNFELALRLRFSYLTS